MDGWLYPASLLIVGLLAYTFFQNHNSKLALLMLGIGIYIVFSSETGYTATGLSDDMIESLDKSAEEWAKEHTATGYDEKGAQKAVK